MNNWGKSTAFDAFCCNGEAIRSKKAIESFIAELVQRIDMVAYQEPLIVRFGTGNKEGYTLVQLIETSNITAHFAEETGDAYFDVFSCKDYDPVVVTEVIDKYFMPASISFTSIDRQAKPLQTGE